MNTGSRTIAIVALLIGAITVVGFAISTFSFEPVERFVEWYKDAATFRLID